jgi:hypothetical protein
MAFIWIGGPQLGIDAWSAGLALLVLAAVVLCMAAALRRKLAISALAGLSVMLGTFYFTYRTLVTPSGSWPVMYAAVNEKTGAERRERITELMSLWKHGEVRRADWYFLSRRWGVCHRMWEQSGCRMPTGHMAPEGFVRDDIYALAKEVK